MKPNYKLPYKAFVKKQHKPLQLAIEDAVEDVCAAPDIGEQKTGDLQGIWVHKFTHKSQRYLIAYRPPTEEERKAEGIDIVLLVIDFDQVGTHENFHAALKTHLKS